MSVEQWGASARLSVDTAWRPEEVIDTVAYPIADHESPQRAALIARLRGALAAGQVCALPGFLQPEAQDLAVAQAMAGLPKGHHNAARRNCYLQRRPDPALPDDHPRNILLEASTRMLAYDQLPANSPLKVLYHWEETRRMIAEIVGAERLYDNADPYQPVNTLCYQTGDRSAWHFDSVNAFTVTLMLQAAEAGGDFEIAPNVRSDDDQRYDEVRKILLGESPERVIKVSREAGELCIFRGCNSLHRVSPVEGARMRIMGVFVYETEPGVVGDPEVNETVYGPRVAGLQ